MWMDFEIPVEKTPLFVGGTGILVEEIAGVLKGRVFPITERAKTLFFGRDGETKSVISRDNPRWENPEIVDLTTGQEVPWEKSRLAFEFVVEEGHDYRVR
jgi:hypothetical protein